jgi:hypothetical protein
MKLIVTFVLFLPLMAGAQDRLLGLIQVPALHSGVNDQSDSTPDQALRVVTLYLEPREDSPVAATIQDRRELETLEHDYEVVSAAVFGRASGYWHKLRYEIDGQTGYGWLHPQDAAIYKDLHSFLYSAGMSYLTEDWDGRIYEEPSRDSPAATSVGKDRNQGARIIAIHYQGTEPWYLVALVSEYCDVKPLEVVATGWIPAYSASGGNTVWHYSRGC